MQTIKRNFHVVKGSYLIFIYTAFFLTLHFTSQINAQQNSIGIRTIILIRHGQYAPQSDELPDSVNRLTSLGIEQARLTAERLKSMNLHFDSLISSTMTRAKQTAMVINQDFPELKLQQDDLLMECTPPSWWKELMKGVDTNKITECTNNLETAFSKYFVPSPDKNDRNDIIVCHGNVIRYLVTKVLRVDTKTWILMSISNCSLTIIRILPDGSMRLDAFGDYGHIPENMRTFTGGNNNKKELLLEPSKN